MSKGIFIVFEGIDGAGTTSNSKLLVEWLKKKNFPAIWTSEPTQHKIGILIKQLLREETVNPCVDALLFAADRMWHVERLIRPYLAKGYIVVSDRYIESSIAYQGAQGVDIDWILEINRGVVLPDVTILLDISPETSLSRIKDRAYIEKFEKIEFLRKAREIYLSRAKTKKYYVLNAEEDLETVQERVRRIVKNYMKKIGYSTSL